MYEEIDEILANTSALSNHINSSASDGDQMDDSEDDVRITSVLSLDEDKV